MADVVFYGKPGCITNRRQVELLRSLGHRVEVRDLLAEHWSLVRLRSFFGRLPVSAWFNRNAPAIQCGAVRPDGHSESDALHAMLEDPLLIRRPLVETDSGRCCGFDRNPLLAALGVQWRRDSNMEACSNPAAGRAL